MKPNVPRETGPRPLTTLFLKPVFHITAHPSGLAVQVSTQSSPPNRG